jgi:murein L,D-transpeptidase YcbB/YkuD
MDAETRTHIRGFQSLMGMRPTGVIDEKTAEAIESIKHHRA